MSVAAHLRTVVHRLRETLAPPEAPPSVRWTTTVEDPRIGPVRLTGRLTAPPPPTPAFEGGEPDARAPGARGLRPCSSRPPRPAPRGRRPPPESSDPSTPSEDGEERPHAGGSVPFVLLVHGLGGSAESYYLRRAAQAAWTRGWASLRCNLRGADMEGEDFYHAGLSGDLHAALASPEVAPYRPLYAVGFSLGGNPVLRMAAEAADPRLAAVAAVSPPLDLGACAEAFDRPGRALYRSYLLSSLKQMYAAVAARRPVPLPVAEARRIRRIQEWDDRLVAPRHGFADARDYYRRMSAGPLLGRLRVPALVVAADDDPLVPPEVLRPSLAAAPPHLETRWLSGVGHLGFSERVDLGVAPAAEPGGSGGDGGAGGRDLGGLEAQILDWLALRV